MAENAGAGGGAKAAAAQAEGRVALGDLTSTSVVADGGRFGAPDSEKELDEATKLKSCYTNVEWLKEKLLEERALRERAEMELSNLKKIEAKADALELELASCKALPTNKPDVPPYGDIPPKFADLQKQALANLNKVGEATHAKESAENATGEVSCLEHMLAAVSEECRWGWDTAGMLKVGDPAMLTKQELRDGDDTSLKELSGLHGMDKVIRALERTIDELSTDFYGRLSTVRSKVTYLERERDQLRSQVALLESKLGHGDYSASSKEILCTVNTLAVDSEAKPELKKTQEWLRAVEELKGQTGCVKKQPVVIDICDDEDSCTWCDDDEKPSLKSNPSGSGEPGDESCHLRGSCGWFFRGNRLMLSSGMKRYLKELCNSIPPAIPFYIYQMNKSNLKRRGKMRLSAKYISKPLLSCLHDGEGCALFGIDGEDGSMVRVKLSADGRASLTSGWENVVAAKDIKVGDICAFHFEISHGVLKLSVYVFRVVRYLVCVK